MIKNIQLLFLVLLLILLAPKSAHALTILVNENGSMSLYQGEVLGEDSESESEKENEVEIEDEKEDSSAERAREQNKKEIENAREREKKAAEQKLKQRKELKTIPAREEKQLKIKNTDRKTEVLIERKADARTPGNSNGERLTTQEQIETERLEIELPVNQKRELEREENAQIKRIRQERQERQDKLEIKSQINDDGSSEFELESGSIKAKLKSAEFVIDPETNNVTITTPSGQTHTLIHLPDQAIQQMIEKGLIDSGELSTAESELSVETKEDGEVVYKTKVQMKRRLLGLIPYEYESEVELNDTDSEITTQPVDTSFIGRLLFNLSR